MQFTYEELLEELYVVFKKQTYIGRLAQYGVFDGQELGFR